MVTINGEKHEVRRLKRTETAKIIKNKLRELWTDTKFSVRSSTYSGGGSIDIAWTDGPTEKEVKKVTAAYSDRSFDGMIDLEYYKYSWLMPDGTAQPAQSSGTGSSRGMYEGYEKEKPHPDAELVSTGSGYLGYSRGLSREWLDLLVDAILAEAKHWTEGFELEPGEREALKYEKKEHARTDRFGLDYSDDTTREILRKYQPPWGACRQYNLDFGQEVSRHHAAFTGEPDYDPTEY